MEGSLRLRDFSAPSLSSSSGGGGPAEGTATWTATGAVLDSAAVGSTVTAMGGYAMSALLDSSGRQELRIKCAERLQEESGMAVQYAEQAVLANLDWGIDGLEKALKATNPETRAARLEHTEKMLQVAVLLDPKRSTAGVPNSYLSAWANFYMALVWKLRNNDRNAALHFLDMFLLEPAHARKTFAPALWEQLFRPHMANIEAWYQGELAQISSAPPTLNALGGGIFPIPTPSRRRPKSMDFVSGQSRSGSKTHEDVGVHTRSLSKSHPEGVDSSSRFSLPRDEPGSDQQQPPQTAGGTPRRENVRRPSMSTDQMMRMELLNKLYEDSLSENTQQYAQYYKDWMMYDADSSGLDGDREQNSPALPRIINPSHSTSSAKLQEAQASGHSRSFGRSSVSTTAAAAAAAGMLPPKGVVNPLQKRVSFHRQSSMDRDADSGSDGSFTDASSYSRNSSMQESYRKVGEDLSEEVNQEGSSEKRTGNGQLKKSDSINAIEEGSWNDEDEYGSSFVEKGVGVYLDGEELREDELLQVWEEISEGRIGLEEANDFLSRLTNGQGQAVDLKYLSETAGALQIYRKNHPENDGPPETTQFYSNNSNSSDSGTEDDEGDVRSWHEFDNPLASESLNDISSMLPNLAVSRNDGFHHKIYTREQSLIRPPKDFVCSITNQLFQDPVTLETGQTYERAAIKEWLDRGNTSCPITRQVLKNHKLPKTNYVLKRLVDNWKDDHPEYFQDLTSGERGSSGRSGRMDGLELEVFEGSLPHGAAHNRTSSMNDEIQAPSRRFGQKVAPLPIVTTADSSPPNLGDMLNQLKSAVDTLFRTEDIAQCERAVIVAMRIWVESKYDTAVASSLSRAGVVEGLMEVLSRSKKDEVLRSIVCLLADLITKDEFTRHTIMRTDPNLESIVTILKNPGVPQVSVLLHLLKVPSAQISALEVIPLLVSVVKSTQTLEGDAFSMCMTPKAAAVYILEQLVTTLDHRENMANAEEVVIAGGVPYVIERLEAKALEEKVSAVAVLWSCLQARGDCRMLMVQNLKISTLVDLLHNNKEQARTVAIFFLAELIRLNRRSVIEKVLKDVLLEGILNSMHVLMLHLQMSPLEHRPLVASLLLQLDLLADPLKHSVYREEALEALVEALDSEDDLKVQLEAAKALASLSGRYSHNGRPSTEASLLKYAGIEDDHRNSVKSDRDNGIEMDQTWEAEEKAAEDWDRRMGLAVLSGGKSLIEALGVSLSSKSSKVVRLCLVAVAWLSCSLQLMPDANLRSCARNCCLPSLLTLLQTGRDPEAKVLACISLHNLTDDSVGVQQLSIFAKDLLGPLRRLRRHTWTAKKILEALAANPTLDLKVEMWAHGEVALLDLSQSGEIRTLLHFRGYLYSGHVDTSIKIWNVRKRTPRMVHEVREHSRAVLCLAVSKEDRKLYSGSADKTIRIWQVEDEGGLRCMQVIDLKEAVHSVAANSSFIFVIPPGIGLKVFDVSGTNARLVNGDKHIQSIAVGNDRVYCGCTDSSIQEIDPATETTWTIQSASQSLRGKRAIYSMHLIGDELFAGGTIVDGIAAKVWKLSTTTLVSSISSQNDVRVMSVSEDLIYLASNLPTGVVEVWSRAEHQQVDTFLVGSKVLTLAVVGETIYTGSVDGKLRAWALI